MAKVWPAAPDEAATVALVDAAADRARERGCARVELDVSEANPAALALYQAAGFSTGEDPGTRDLLMRLPL